MQQAEIGRVSAPNQVSKIPVPNESRPGPIGSARADSTAGETALELAELEAENARLRRLLDEAGQNAEAAFVLLARADARHQRELERVHTEAASARAMLRQAYQDTSEHKRLVAQELQHRAKNMLAVVQAIALQTLRSAVSLEEARGTLVQRIAALRHANDLLLEDEQRRASIRKIVGQAVSLLADGRPNRVQVSGPDVELEARTALAFGMVLHELGTNAVKYGSLSTETGQVEITWSIQEATDGRQVSFRWTERGGPSVNPPNRKGFGSRLLERLGGDLRGRVDLAFEASGLICVISAGLSP